MFALWSISGQTDVLPKYLQFEEERLEVASQFAIQIAGCVSRRDTRHPAFYGCIDWHSAVHGTWALIAYTRISKDNSHLSAIESVLQNDLLKLEQSYLDSFSSFEMPYGRAWFLRLVIEYKKTFGRNDLQNFADSMASSLMSYLIDEGADPKSKDYKSASWALINLYDYAESEGDEELKRSIEEILRSDDWYIKEGMCPIEQYDTHHDGFMAMCTNWAWAVARVLPCDERKKWLKQFLPPSSLLKPVEKPVSAHQFGLNFSRAWGLAGLYHLSGESAYLKSFLDHFYTAWERESWWRGDYRAVGHWVAQFGFFALIASYGEGIQPCI